MLVGETPVFKFRETPELHLCSDAKGGVVLLGVGGLEEAAQLCGGDVVLLFLVPGVAGVEDVGVDTIDRHRDTKAQLFLNLRLDVVELGCGTGYVSYWAHLRGARTITGIDNSPAQLATATQRAASKSVTFPTVLGDAHRLPYADDSFDVAINEYGAAIWCDPELWVREAHRLLRPDGRLVFLGNSPLTLVCTPLSGAHVDRTLHRSYFDMGRVDFSDAEIDPGGIEFNRPLSSWFELFRTVGFRVDDYREPRAPDTATGTEFAVSADWSREWPSEQVFWLTRT